MLVHMDFDNITRVRKGNYLIERALIRDGGRGRIQCYCVQARTLANAGAILTEFKASPMSLVAVFVV
jgi:hypothetical protein